MLARRWKLLLVSGVILAAAAACSFTTANISNLKTAKDEAGNTEASAFQPRDTVYARATVSNAPGKITLKWRMIAEKVEGHPENMTIPGSETTVELPGSAVGTYSLSAPTKGWPAGSYRIEVAMLIESGEQKDQETVKFTVEGGSTQTSAPTNTPETPQPAGDAKTGSVSLTRMRLTSNLKSDFDAPSESTFAPDDHVYVVYTAENLPTGGQINCHLYAEDVEGVKPGENLRLLSYKNPPGMKFTEKFDLDPTQFGGTEWAKGTYRIELSSQAGGDAPAQELRSAKFKVE
jgi:hypothetical protein